MYFAEDLVLAEERTSKKDRQRIMEGKRYFQTSVVCVKSLILLRTFPLFFLLNYENSYCTEKQLMAANVRYNE
jgi:hypothetical protein